MWNDTSGSWSADAFRDVYHYTYKCGHVYTVSGNSMQAGGQVAPPLCPSCHGMATIDRLEAENWRHNPKWQGYQKEFVAGFQGTGASIPGATGARAWLDYEIGRVRQKAWQGA